MDQRPELALDRKIVHVHDFSVRLPQPVVARDYAGFATGVASAARRPRLGRYNESTTLRTYCSSVTGSRRSLNPTLGGRIGPRVWPAVDAYLAIAKAARLDPAQMAIAWAMSRPVPTVPIIGATTREQLANVLAAADVRLSPEVSAAIAAAHRAHPLPY